MATKKKTCFVIMPFSKTTPEHTEEYWTAHYEDFLKPIIEEIGDIEVKRSETLRGDILKEIIYNLAISDIVIADITDSNPNVHWELGVRHSLKNGTIPIKDNNYARRPFDVSMISILEYYPKDHIKNEKFKIQLQKSIRDCCRDARKTDSYVLDTLAGRGSLYDIINKEEIKRKIEGLDQEYKYNLFIYERIIDQSSKNLELKKKIKQNLKNKKKSIKGIYITSRNLRCNSLELLITTRYIDETIEFYQKLESIVNMIYSFTETKNQWLTMPKRIEKWFIKYKKSHDAEIEEYEKCINYLKEKYIK
jgi:hypothetical protein